jgi:tripartite-type tricarboxylate transporter receptor subunit TctC
MYVANRRQLLHLAAGAAAVPGLSQRSDAQAYPSRHVRIIVPFSPAGGNDFHARLFAQLLSERLGYSFVVDNRPGASGTIGTAEVVRAAPDGHTLLGMSVALAVSAAFYTNLTYDLVRDIAPVAAFIRSSYVLLVHPSLPVKTVPEFIDYAKRNSASINMGSNGVGATGHLAGELFNSMSGLSLLHVPYRGEGAALADLTGGQVHVLFASMTASMHLVRAGQLRALAVTSSSRSPALPSVPTVAESLSGYELDSWAGLGAPRNTRQAAIEKLNQEINAALKSEFIKVKYADLGGSPFPASPSEFGNFLADDVQKWTRVMKIAGIKPG